MANNSVDTDNLVDDAVTTDKILNANVTTAKIADANITTSKILDANVTTAKIADGAVTLPKMAADVIKVAASKADQIAANSSNVYTNPLYQQHHPSAAKFLCCFNGTTVGTNAPIFGYNVTSVTRDSAGTYTINLTVPFVDTNYVIVGMCNTISVHFPFVSIKEPLSATNPSITVQNASQTLLDTGYVCIIGFGLQ
jgi:hypothetical protein